MTTEEKVQKHIEKEKVIRPTFERDGFGNVKK